MGWTCYKATHYYKNGKVNRKAEVDMLFTQEEHDGSNYSGGICHYPKMEVIKSSMVGSVYYGAIRSVNTQTGNNRTWGVVVLTSTANLNGFDFAYKDISEDMEPGYYDCPQKILDLLSPTDNEYALVWRRKCREKLAKPKLSELPVGTIIKYKDWNGEDIELIKHPAAYQFKKPFWTIKDGSGYVSTKYIPDDFEIVEE